MAYVVNVNDPLQPSNAKGAGQAAEELRAIKLKLSGFLRNIDGSYVISTAVNIDAALETSSFKTTSAEITGALTVGDIQSSTFVGMLADFPSAVLKDGWLKCNGAAVSRITYAALFAYLGTAYGAGDGVTTFNLPDYRGEFRRTWDDGRGIDTGRVIGSTQDGQNQSHRHFAFSNSPTLDPASNPLTASSYASKIGATGGESNYNIAGSTTIDSAVGLTSSSGGAETRPRNMAVMTCIKY